MEKEISKLFLQYRRQWLGTGKGGGVGEENSKMCSDSIHILKAQLM